MYFVVNQLMQFVRLLLSNVSKSTVGGRNRWPQLVPLVLPLVCIQLDTLASNNNILFPIDCLWSFSCYCHRQIVLCLYNAICMKHTYAISIRAVRGSAKEIAVVVVVVVAATGWSFSLWHHSVINDYHSIMTYECVTSHILKWGVEYSGDFWFVFRRTIFGAPFVCRQTQL